VLDLARRISRTDFQTVVFGPKEGLKAIGSLAQNVHAIGHIPGRDLAMLFRNAHAFIAPSLYEGFGLPVLEAMSCGCAVIASSGGALPEIIGNGAQIFGAFDIAAMADAFAELMRHPDALERWRNSALERAADFSLERAAMETLRVYHHFAFGEQPEWNAAAAD
jgi:glycosyltransferase involved in cell wall biosynthesis